MNKLLLITSILSLPLHSLAMAPGADQNLALINQASKILHQYDAGAQFANSNLQQDLKTLANLRNAATTKQAKRAIQAYEHELHYRTDLNPPACLNYRDPIPK